MSITRGAKKAHRSSLRKRVHNLQRKKVVSQSTKSFKKLVATGNIKEAEMMLRQVQSALDKAVKGKTIKKNTASRKKSRLTKLVKKLS